MITMVVVPKSTECYRDVNLILYLTMVSEKILKLFPDDEPQPIAPWGTSHVCMRYQYTDAVGTDFLCSDLPLKRAF